MKTIGNIMLVAFAAASVIACQKEMTTDKDLPATGGIVTFTGAMDKAQTKTAIHYEDGKEEFETLFTSSDYITVNGVKSEAPSTEQNQTVIKFNVSDVTAPYYAVTATQNKEWDEATKTYTLQISGTGAPQEFRTVDGGNYVSYHSSTDILAAYSENEDIHFKHLTTFYAITVDKANSAVQDNIKTIYVRQGDGSYIAGTWKLTFDETGNTTLEPSNTTAYIAFNCGEGGVGQGTPMIVGLPAYDYDEGLIFTLKDVNDKFASYMVKPEKTAHSADGGKIITFKPAFNPGAGVIRTAEDWNEFAEFVNNPPQNDWEIYRWIGDGSNTIKLGADITAEDLTPITADFTYTFDGNGKTITRTAATQALFSTVSGEVRNLTLAGELVLADEGAPLANTLSAGGKISGCTNKMKISFNNADHAYVGGLVRIMSGGAIENCVNEGAIDVIVDVSSGYKNAAVGGIVAQVNAGEENISILNCKNISGVTLSPKSASDASHGMKVCGLGGIVGWLRAAASFMLDNCDNEGNVTLSADYITSETGTAAYDICVGGVIGIAANQDTGGYLSTPTATNGFNISMSGCDNSGVVRNNGVVYLGGSTTTKKQINKRVFTGGVAGSVLGLSADYAELTSCTNTGEVYTYDLTGTGASTQPCYSSVSGGLIGFGGYLKMDQCEVNCIMGNGKRAVMCYGGVIGCCVRPFTLSNSSIFVSGYYQRIGNYSGNRAMVAVVPVLFGTNTANTMNIAPDIKGSTISNCNIGGYVNTTTSALSTANGEKTDDLSGTYDFVLFDSADKVYKTDGSVNNLVCGQGYATAADDVTVTGYTYWDGK